MPWSVGANRGSDAAKSTLTTNGLGGTWPPVQPQTHSRSALIRRRMAAIFSASTAGVTFGVTAILELALVL